MTYYYKNHSIDGSTFRNILYSYVAIVQSLVAKKKKEKNLYNFKKFVKAFVVIDSQFQIIYILIASKASLCMEEFTEHYFKNFTRT